jgi:hypothetical protein
VCAAKYSIFSPFIASSRIAYCIPELLPMKLTIYLFLTVFCGTAALLLRKMQMPRHLNVVSKTIQSSSNYRDLNARKYMSNDFSIQKNMFSSTAPNGEKVLSYLGLMVAGAIARSVAATAVHPLNVIKTVLQTKDGVLPKLTWRVLSRGAGAQLLMSIPHGALSFALTEVGCLQHHIQAYLLSNCYSICNLIIAFFMPSRLKNVSQNLSFKMSRSLKKFA